MRVSDADGLRRALAAAQAGDVIELAPGDYPITSTLSPAAGGLPQAPIMVRGQPGARLLSRTAVVLRLAQPHWMLEGLSIEGDCQPANRCETGLQLLGNARQLRLQQLQLKGFNTAILVRGDAGNWPDQGRLSDSLIANATPRSGGSAGVGLDLGGASGWLISGNRFADLGRDGAVGYALLLRGGGEGNRVERNLISCAAGGRQVGIGLGGSRTGTRLMRHPERDLEQLQTQIAHNLVVNCGEAALDLYRSADARVEHNHLLASGGIDLRGGSSATLVANLSSGAWYPRRGNLLGGNANRRWSPRATELRQALQEAQALAPAGAEGLQP